MAKEKDSGVTDDRLLETVARLDAILPRLELKVDHLEQFVQDRMETVQAMLVQNLKEREATCPHKMSIAASAKGINEVREGIEELQSIPGKKALEDKTMIRNMVITAIVTLVLAKGQDILAIVF